MSFLEVVPVEMRAMSVISCVLFGVAAVAFCLIYQRITTLETTVVTRSTEIERLAEMMENIEETLKSLKDDHQRTTEWIREDIKGYTNSVEKSLSEIRRQMYKD